MTEESPNPAGGTRDVFVSYASQDVIVADTIVAALEKNGLKCWIAHRDVIPGALYADGIIRAINKARVMVLVLSANAIASKHVGKRGGTHLIQRSAGYYLESGSCTLDDCARVFLEESQWIDVPALGMPAARRPTFSDTPMV